jgi:hypothetical protein
MEAERLAEEQRQASLPPPPTTEQKAEHVREVAGAAFLHGAFRAGGPGFDVETFKVYLTDFLKRAGASGDPLEEMLLRQLVQADFAIGRLHVGAGASADAAAVGAYVAAAARLMTEFRRTLLVLEKVRETAARRQATAAAPPPAPQGRKRRQAAAANGKPGGKKEMTLNTELGSNAPVNRLNEYLRECEVAHS